MLKEPAVASCVTRSGRVSKSYGGQLAISVYQSIPPGWPASRSSQERRLVLPRGIEPPTSSLPMKCSTPELRQHVASFEKGGGLFLLRKNKTEDFGKTNSELALPKSSGFALLNHLLFQRRPAVIILFPHESPPFQTLNSRKTHF